MGSQLSMYACEGHREARGERMEAEAFSLRDPDLGWALAQLGQNKRLQSGEMKMVS